MLVYLEDREQGDYSIETVIDMEVAVGTYLTALSALTRVCDADECELIEEMILNAADYV